MPARQWRSRQAAELSRSTGVRDPVLAMQGLAAKHIDDVGLDQPPFDPRILASFRNVIEVRRVPMTSAARLVPDGAALRIEVNEDHSTGRQNFSADHEVSHTLMPGYTGEGIDDEETGAFPSNQEEEYLCDVGAAALLLDPRWLRPLAREAGPSLATLSDLAVTFAASLEATARQLASLDLWPCAFVFWEEGLRKEERVPAGQRVLPGLTMLGGPVPKLRVARCYASPCFSSSGYFVPPNKSVPDNSLVAACSDFEPHTHGIEVFNFGRGIEAVRLHCENWHAPYLKGTELRRRVVSLLLLLEDRTAPSEPATATSLGLL